MNLWRKWLWWGRRGGSPPSFTLKSMLPLVAWKRMPRASAAPNWASNSPFPACPGFLILLVQIPGHVLFCHACAFLFPALLKRLQLLLVAAFAHKYLGVPLALKLHLLMAHRASGIGGT